MLADRATGKIVPQIYEAPPFFTFHHGNAYEKDGYLIMDLSYYSDATVHSYLTIRSFGFLEIEEQFYYVDCYRFNLKEHERKRLLYKPVLHSLRSPIKSKGSFLLMLIFCILTLI